MKELTLIGNLGKDADLKQIGDYHALQFSVATTERVKTNDVTTWSNVTYWGKKEQLEKLSSHLKKGKKVMLRGSFNVDIYNDKPQINMTAQTLVLC